MSRIPQTFNSLQTRGAKALIPFITAGDPNPAATLPLLHELVGAGADIIELGVPFSDPMADGPVIQRASERALAHGVTLSSVLEMVHAFRHENRHTPIVLMGYLNPIEIIGYEKIAHEAASAGVDGILTVDLPPEEAAPWLIATQAAEIDPIFLLAPTSNAERIAAINRVARGFVYYVSLKGVTGAAHLDINTVADKIAEIRQTIKLPIGVGFGIRDAAAAAVMAQIADAVIVGSAVVSRIENLTHAGKPLFDEIRAFISELRVAIDQSS